MRFVGFALICTASISSADAPKPAKPDLLAPKVLAGPFASVEAACLDWNKRHSVDSTKPWDGYSHTCTNLDTDRVKFKKPALGGLFLDLAAFQTADRTALEIAVKTKDGWFLHELPGKGSRGTAHCGGTNFTATATVGKRAVPELRVEYTSTGSCSHKDRAWEWSETGVTVIGLGTKPAATPAIVTKLVEKAQNKITAEVTATPTWNADGSVDLKGKVTPKQPTTTGDAIGEDLLGHHVLAFP
jgi:hypothetical protein